MGIYEPNLADIDGRPYARVDDVKAGDVLIADGGFTCIEAGMALHVMQHSDGGLYVGCSHGGHMLDGQIEGPVYIGLYPSEAA